MFFSNSPKLFEIFAVHSCIFKNLKKNQNLFLFSENNNTFAPNYTTLKFFEVKIINL